MMNTNRPSRRARNAALIRLRLRPGQKEMIAAAACAKRQTLTTFVVEQAVSAAEQVLAEQTRFELGPDRWEAFLAGLDAPPKGVPALRKLLTDA